MQAIQSLAVFCGSKAGNNPAYINDASQIGTLMAQQNIELIYGGGGKGLMGAVANAVLNNGGKVTGIIPTVLLSWEQQHTALTHLIEVADMHVRKRMMYDKSDAAIILPGGFGTLDELFEMLTWNQLSIHSKKIFILNTAGFYNHLIAHIATMHAADFLYTTAVSSFSVATNPLEIFDALSPFSTLK